MRLVTFSLASPIGDLDRVGAILDDNVIDLQSAHERRLVGEGAHRPFAKLAAKALFGEMVNLVALGPWGLEQARQALDAATDSDAAPVQDVRLRAPLRPVAFRDCMAFEHHVRNALGGSDGIVPPVWYEQPIYYKGNPDTIIGPDDTVPWPSYTEHLDYELELGVVIGRSGTDIAAESARDHIFGLTILNDFSARDIQKREMSVGLGPAKGKDFSTATGPWIATLDELPELYDLKMTAQVDGDVWSEGNTSAIHWRLEEIIAHLSRDEPVRAGELFGTGTVGFGCGLELGRQLGPGNVVELEITGLGRLRNTIGEPPAEEAGVASALRAVG